MKVTYCTFKFVTFWHITIPNPNLFIVHNCKPFKAEPLKLTLNLRLKDMISSRFAFLCEWTGKAWMCLFSSRCHLPRADGWRRAPRRSPGPPDLHLLPLQNRMAYLSQTLSVVFPGLIKKSSGCKWSSAPQQCKIGRRLVRPLLTITTWKWRVGGFQTAGSTRVLV